MAVIAEGWYLCFFTLTKQDILLFVEHHFHTSEWRPDYFLMVAVAERHFFSEAAAAPGIYLAGFNADQDGLAVGHLREIFIGNGFHQLSFIFYE